MSYPVFSDFPPIPQRSAPEADFDAKMYALFQHFATTHRDELIALVDFLRTGSTVLGGALNDTTVGLETPAAGAFTALTADSLGGAAVQANWLDAAAGKLLKAGAFGWGHDAANGSSGGVAGPLSDITVTGVYRYSTANSDAPGSGGMVLHFNRIPESSAGGRMQLALSNTGEVLVRTQDGVDPVTYGGWVSYLPQRGSNANGDFVRLPDGTQMCWTTRPAVDCQASQGSIFMHASLLSWTFPATFAPGSIPKVTGSGGNTTRWLGVAGASDTDVNYRVLGAYADAATQAPALTAIGTWK